MTNDNLVIFPHVSGRKEVYTFPCGSTVTLEVAGDEPSLTVQKAVYLLSATLHDIHAAMLVARP